MMATDMSAARLVDDPVARDVSGDPAEALDRAIRDMREALADEAPRSSAPAAPGLPFGRELFLAIPVTIEAVLGSVTLPMAELMALKRGSRINLDRKLGEALEITANGRRIAFGELTVIETDPPAFGIVLTEIVGA